MSDKVKPTDTLPIASQPGYCKPAHESADKSKDGSKAASGGGYFNEAKETGYRSIAGRPAGAKPAPVPHAEDRVDKAPAKNPHAKDRMEKAPAQSGKTPPSSQTSEAERLHKLEEEMKGVKAELAAEKAKNAALGKSVAEMEVETEEAKAAQAEADREKGWLRKALTEVMSIFLRMFVPLLSMISLVVRVINVVYRVAIAKEDLGPDFWKRQGKLFLADILGSLPALGILAGGVPGLIAGATLGGLGSAGLHAWVAATDEDSHDFFGWEREGPSGIYTGWNKAKDFAVSSYNKVLGKEDAKVAKQAEAAKGPGMIATKPITVGVSG